MPELSVPLPIVIVPSLKVIVPVGVTPELVTVAVNVTDFPKTEGFALDVRVVVVVALLTVCINVVLVLVLDLVSPPYDAVIE